MQIYLIICIIIYCKLLVINKIIPILTMIIMIIMEANQIIVVVNQTGTTPYVAFS